jgi:transposase-like protein
MMIIVSFCEGMSIHACHVSTGVARSNLTNYYDDLRGFYTDSLLEEPVRGVSSGPYECDEFRIDHVRLSDGTFSTVWILDIFERETGRYFAVPVASRSSEQLIPRIREFVPFGSLIFTDDWAAYRPLSSLWYRHYTVTHSAGEYSRDEMIDGKEVSVHINTLEGIHSSVRRRLLNKSRRDVERIELILGEEIYRRSGRSLFSPFKVNQ